MSGLVRFSIFLIGLFTLGLFVVAPLFVKDEILKVTRARTPDLRFFNRQKLIFFAEDHFAAGELPSDRFRRSRRHLRRPVEATVGRTLLQRHRRRRQKADQVIKPEPSSTSNTQLPYILLNSWIHNEKN